jgi:hypothetical protein
MWKDLTVILESPNQIIEARKATEWMAASISENPSVTQIRALEARLKQFPQIPGVDKATHYFGLDTYVREYRQPAYTIVIGKMHSKDHVFAIIAGEVTVISPEGTQRIRAPYVTESRAGIKRIVIAHSDVIFLTVHPNPTNTRDLAQLERELILDPDNIIEGSFEQVPTV